MKTQYSYALGWKTEAGEGGKIPSHYTYNHTIKTSRSIIISVLFVLGVVFIFSQILATMADRFTFNLFEISEAVAAEVEAKKLIQSHREVNIAPGSGFTFMVGFKNYGDKVWDGENDSKVSLKVLNQNTKSIVFHEFWRDERTPAWLLNGDNLPGRIGYYRFALKAPESDGVYTEEFGLFRGNALIPGSEFDIEFHVGDVSKLAAAQQELKEVAGIKETAQVSNPSPVLEPKPAPTVSTAPLQAEQVLVEEPIIRVGLYGTEDDIVLTADKGYKAIEENGAVLFSALPNQESRVSFNFNTKVFTVVSSGVTVMTAKNIRFEPVSVGEIIFTLLSHEDRPTWNESINYNRFLGIIETRYSWNKENIRVINELPMEDYLEGLAESTNYSPLEYQKALVTAARTYALYHYILKTKNAADKYDVHSIFDQVYKGYVSSQYLTKVVKAVEETRGMVVTYNNDIVVTPYFSHSDGRTRAWSEVWNGEKPWLVSVKEPEGFDKDTMFGHGVGMSAWGAFYLARDHGYTWDQILQYYYTNVEIDGNYNNFEM